METNIRKKYTARVQRLPYRSASGGSARHPKIVATERRMVAYEDRRVISMEARPCLAPRKATAEGTYAEPAHNPLIETKRYSALRYVLRRNVGENNMAIARRADSGGFQRAGSCTPNWISTTRNAGSPPMANIARQP